MLGVKATLMKHKESLFETMLSSDHSQHQLGGNEKYVFLLSVSFLFT